MKKTTFTINRVHTGLKLGVAVFVFTIGTHLGVAQSVIPDADPEVNGFSVINSTNPVGTIIAVAGESRPVGYLFCDGREVSKTDYPDLFAAIGNTYGGSGDYFMLPDLRGQFLRGFNGDANTDADRKDNDNRGIGTYQADKLKSHDHTMNNAGEHVHGMNGLARQGASNAGPQGSGVNDAVAHNKDTEPAGEHKHIINPTGGSETRPLNMAVAYYIKATNGETFEGYVGIGTTTPSEQLDVSGNIYSNGNIYSEGNVGIGTTTPTEKLEVVGTIKADGVKLDVCSFPDYVFAEEYNLLPLEELASYIKKNNHLPGMPAEAEVLENGMDLAQVNIVLVEKVEELTLYTLSQEHKLEDQEETLNLQEKEISLLKEELARIKMLVESKSFKD